MFLKEKDAYSGGGAWVKRTEVVTSSIRMSRLKPIFPRSFLILCC